MTHLSVTSFAAWFMAKLATQAARLPNLDDFIEEAVNHGMSA